MYEFADGLPGPLVSVPSGKRRTLGFQGVNVHSQYDLLINAKSDSRMHQEGILLPLKAMKVGV